MKPSKLQNKFSAALIASAALLTVPASAENEYGTYVSAPEGIRAADMWKTSWVQGREYHSLASFCFDAEIKVKEGEDSSWQSKLCFWSLGDIRGRQKLSGASTASTSVSVNDPASGELALVRNFGTTNVEADFYADTSESWLPNIVMKTVFEDEKIKAYVEDCTKVAVAGGAWIAVTAANCFGVPLPEWAASLPAGKVAEIILERTKIGEKLEQEIRGKFRSMGFEEAELDGEKVWKVVNKSEAAKYLGKSAEFAEYAVQLSESFRSKDYLIFSDADGIVSAKLVSPENVGEIDPKRGDFESLKTISGTTPKDAEACFKREALALNEKLFGGRERKVGDYWEADSSFMNSFLHPDLKGKFEGRILLQYEKDASVVDKWNGRFEARVIVMKLRHGNLETNTRYKEDDFSVSLSGKRTSITFYVDKKTNLLRKAEIKAESTMSDGNLPQSIFTKGLRLDGDITCDFSYDCRESELPFVEKLK